jgi:hypothetical protein
MTNITGRYLEALARLALAVALFLCCAPVCPSMRSLPSFEHPATPSSSRNTTAYEIEQIRRWFAERYTSLRFVYEVEMQVSRLYAAENERERKQAGKHS